MQWITTARMLRRAGFGVTGPEVDAAVTQYWPGYVDAMLGAIVAFRMIIERIDPKFKLSQNRSAEDEHRVIGELRVEGFSDAEARAHWMASHAGER